LGRLDAIRRFPIKSLRGEALEEVAVDANGLRGDRRRALLVRDGPVRVGKTYRGKEDDRLHLIADPAAATAAAAERGLELALENDGPFFDDAPVSIVVDRWLDALSAHVGYRVEWLRFRPNFFVLAAPEFDFDERHLTGKEVRLGAVRLRVRGPIGRCVVTTYDPQGGPSDPEILRYIAQQRDNTMGVYCDVIAGGTVRIGDALALQLAPNL